MVPHLSPTTLTGEEQALILRVSQAKRRDRLIFSPALGTGLRLAEIVGLNVGDVFALGGTPRIRVRVRREIAKGGRAERRHSPAEKVQLDEQTVFSYCSQDRRRPGPK